MFSLIDVRSGEPMLQKTVRGNAHTAPKDKVDVTGAFYRCFDEALELFVDSSEFKSLLKPPPKTGNP